VQPLLEELEKADRSQVRCEKDVDFAGRQLAVLTKGVERFGERRRALARSVFDLNAGASRSLASSGSAVLQRKARERTQEIRKLDERLAGYREKLLMAKWDLGSKQSELHYLQKNVSRLEHAIAQSFPPAARADDSETVAGPDGQLHPDSTVDTGGYELPPLDDGENVVSWEDDGPATYAETRSTVPAGAARGMIRRRTLRTRRLRRVRRVRRRARVPRDLQY